MKPNMTPKSHIPIISTYPYLGGKAVTSKLCSLLNIDEYQNLADVFGIPRGTVSTWHSRETTPFEIATHLIQPCFISLWIFCKKIVCLCLFALNHLTKYWTTYDTNNSGDGFKCLDLIGNQEQTTHA